MEILTPKAWLESQPLFPYRSREALVKAAMEYATQIEREACALLAPVKVAKAIRARSQS